MPYHVYSSLLFLDVLLICSSLDPAIVPTALPGHDPVTQSKYYRITVKLSSLKSHSRQRTALFTTAFTKYRWNSHTNSSFTHVCKRTLS